MWRSEKYLEFVRKHPCVGCLRTEEIQAHHFDKRNSGGGTALKASDCQTVPLCPRCHQEVHRQNKTGHLTALETERRFLRAALQMLGAWLDRGSV
jgi:hypothetical protein